MTDESQVTGKRPSRQARAASPEDAKVSLSTAVFLDGYRGGLLVAGGLFFVALVALLDHETESHFSFSLFYLIPVAVCAWWGGFSRGILVALAGAVAWHAVDSFQGAQLSPTVGLWNGIVRFGILTLISSLVSRLHSGVRREYLLARTDPLTGAANGRTFYEAAAAQAGRASRSSRPLTLAYLDLDNFKQLNDRLGHAAGDAALRHVVQTIRLNLRSTDLLARLGGDEFAILLPEMDAEGTVALLARLQALLSRETVRHGWPVTLSVGAITFRQPPTDVDLMIQQVDTLMYQAKRKGKGRVEHEVVEGLSAIRQESEWRLERRATARVLGNRTARVWPEGQEGAGEEFAAVRDLSAGDIRLHLEKCFAVNTLLLVESLAPVPKSCWPGW